jgi:hypothetical protein
VLETVLSACVVEFMIAAQKVEVIGELAKECEKKRNTFDGEFTAIHVIPEKEVTRIHTEVVQQADKIKETPVNIADNANWDINLQNHRL